MVTLTLNRYYGSSLLCHLDKMIITSNAAEASLLDIRRLCHASEQASLDLQNLYAFFLLEGFLP
jgi:hypothetical protein